MMKYAIAIAVALGVAGCEHKSERDIADIDYGDCNARITSCNGPFKWEAKGPYYRGSSRMISFHPGDKRHAGGSLAVTLDIANKEGGTIVVDEHGHYFINCGLFILRSARIVITANSVTLNGGDPDGGKCMSRIYESN